MQRASSLSGFIAAHFPKILGFATRCTGEGNAA
jgi:hypothetical protein